MSQQSAFVNTTVSLNQCSGQDVACAEKLLLCKQLCCMAMFIDADPNERYLLFAAENLMITMIHKKSIYQITQNDEIVQCLRCSHCF